MKERTTSLLSKDDSSDVLRDEGVHGYTSVEHLALDTGLRFRMPKQQRKSVDVLLQEMFEDELEEDDVGPKELDDLDELGELEELQQGRSRRKFTFLTVDAD